MHEAEGLLACSEGPTADVTDHIGITNPVNWLLSQLISDIACGNVAVHVLCYAIQAVCTPSDQLSGTSRAFFDIAQDDKCTAA